MASLRRIASGFILLLLPGCISPLSRATIIPPAGLTPSRIAQDYEECRDRAQTILTTVVPAGPMLADVPSGRTDDELFLTCLHSKQYDVGSASSRRRFTEAAEETDAGSRSRILPLYETVIAGKRCRSIPLQTIECDFSVGRDLHFTVSHIGERHARLTRMESTPHGGVSMNFSLLPACVAIHRPAPSDGASTQSNRAGAEIVFVAIANAKIYLTERECHEGS